MGGLRAGVIGCGDAGGAHALTLAGIRGVTVTALFDLVRARAAEVAARHGGAVVASVEEMVGNRVDLVAIATGPVDQPAIVDRLVAAGYRGALLCEKPLATSLPAARGLVETAAGAGVVLAVNHERRFGAPAVAARRLVARGEIGRLLRVEGFSPDGTLFDWAPHWIDLTFDFAGDAPVRWVHGLLDLTTRREHAGLPLESHGLLVWEHDNGVRGQLECGRRVSGQPFVRLLGDEGLIEIGSVVPGPGGYIRGPALRVHSAAARSWREIEVGESALAAVQWQRSWEELIDAAAGGRPPEHDGPRALRALEVCLAGYLAAARGEPRSLPLSSGTDLRTVLSPPAREEATGPVVAR